MAMAGEKIMIKNQEVFFSVVFPWLAMALSMVFPRYFQTNPSNDVFSSISGVLPRIKMESKTQLDTK